MRFSIEINNEKDFNTCIDILHSMGYSWYAEPQEYISTIKMITPHRKHISYSCYGNNNFVIFASEFQQCAQYLLLK